jgi:hypothetical protein
VHFYAGWPLIPAEPALRKRFSTVSADFGSPPGFRPFCRRNPCEKVAENVHGMLIAMLDEKDVQNVRKIRGFSADSPRNPLCKSLWITCGEVADKARKYDQSDSSGRMKQLF